MKWLLVSPTSNKGFTLLELMVGIAMTLTVSALALAALTNAEQGFTKDKNKIEGGQKLSSILDIIGRDILQAGEQISESQFPVVKVVPDGSNGSRLVVYRAIEEALPVCSNIAANTSINEVFVASNDATTRLTSPSCDVSGDANVIGGSYPANVQTWIKRRTATTNPTPNQISVILHDGQGKTQLFTYLGENQSNSQQTVKLSATAFTPTDAFPIRSTAYLVDKREYLICNSELKVRVNNKSEGSCSDTGSFANTSASPFQTIATNITKMDISLTVRDPQTPTTTNPNPPDIVSELAANVSFPSSARYWRNLQGVTVQITATNPSNNANAEPIVASGRFYPRNILSSYSQ
jgi:prepilin-type N-terminal cleavage/methylation domain-containing protein